MPGFLKLTRDGSYTIARLIKLTGWPVDPELLMHCYGSRWPGGDPALERADLTAMVQELAQESAVWDDGIACLTALKEYLDCARHSPSPTTHLGQVLATPASRQEIARQMHIFNSDEHVILMFLALYCLWRASKLGLVSYDGERLTCVNPIAAVDAAGHPAPPF